MPNWCYNYATFKNEDITKIDALEAVLLPDEGSEELFNTIRPIPLEEEDNWYNWNLENWGTKWEARIHDYYRDENEINVSFETAWCPPIALYEWMIKNDWEVNAYYHESGQGFAGNFCKEDDYHEYDLTDRETWEDIDDDIKEFANFESDYEWLMEQTEEDEK